MFLLDRQLIRSYLKAYLICFISLLSLYIVIDLFTNIDDFTSANQGVMEATNHILTYYAYRSTQIFDKLSEAIVLLAAVFTVAWLQRNNELVPLLSAGISTQRVVRPVILSATLMLGLSLANQELLVPHIADQLLNARVDPQGDGEVILPWAYETNGILLAGQTAYRKQGLVKNFCVTIPENLGNGLVELAASEARYIPRGSGKYSGGWLLTETQPPQLDNWTNTKILEPIDAGKYFLYTQDVDMAALTRHSKWFVFASTYQLFEEMSKPESKKLSPMAVLFHMRLTRPILGLILVFLGLAVILRDQNRNVFVAAGMCLVMGATVFAGTFFCKFLGDHDFVAPALAAWGPVLFFGPLAFVLFDAVHS
jgi:lipopolysaccharide export system permease protein